MTKEEISGFINSIELAIDYGMPISDEDWEKYCNLIKENKA